MSGTYHCAICNVVCDSEQQLQFHESGKKHRAHCLRSQSNGDAAYSGLTIALPRQTTPHSSPVRGEKSNLFACTPLDGSTGDGISRGSHYCDICKCHTNSPEQFSIHIGGQRHQRKLKLASLKSAIQEMAESTTTGQMELESYEITLSSPNNSGSTSPVHDHLAVDTLSPSVSDKHPTKDYLVWRKFQRSCREFLGPIWPHVTFTQEESDTLLSASESDNDCVLLLPNPPNDWFLIGIHLITALLEANKSTEITGSTTLAAWISPNRQSGPDPQLFSTYIFPWTCCPGTRSRHLQLGEPPLNQPWSVYDLLLLDADDACAVLPEILFRQNLVCAIVVQDASVLGTHSKLCDMFRSYLHQFPLDKNRARIICLTSSSLPAGCLFNLFELVNFAPRT